VTALAGEAWRILFMGQAPLGEAAYRELKVAGSAALCLVAVSSNAVASGKWWNRADIFQDASSHVAFVSNETRNEQELERVIRRCDVNCIISVQHPWVLPASILRLVDYRAFNLHNGLLPDYGGFNAVSHAILDGATRFGSTLHWMVESPDSGRIAFVEDFSVPPRVTATQLYAMTVEAGLRAFHRLLDTLATGDLPPRLPMATPRLHARHDLEKNRQIADPSDDDELDRKARAFWFPPFEPAYILTRLGIKYYVSPETTDGPRARTDSS
jgi:methionyl-tRNA formyltransferase